MIKLTKILKEIVVKPTSAFKFNIGDKVELEGDDTFPGEIIHREPNWDALKQFVLQDKKWYFDLYYDLAPAPYVPTEEEKKLPFYVVKFVGTHPDGPDDYDKIVAQRDLEPASGEGLEEIIVKPARVGTVVLVSPGYAHEDYIAKKSAREEAVEWLKELQSDYESDYEPGTLDYSPQITRWDTGLYSVYEYYPDAEILAECIFIGSDSDLYDLALRRFDDPKDNEAIEDFDFAMYKKDGETYTIKDINEMP